MKCLHSACAMFLAALAVPATSSTTNYNEPRRPRRERQSAPRSEPLVNRQSAPSPQMLPAIHPRHNKRDVAHLHSKRAATLFYTQNGNIYLQDSDMVATLDALFHWDTVVLDHSDYIKNVSCQAQQMTIQLASPAAFSSAQTNWTQDDTIVFVSSSPSCHDKSPGQFAYFNTTAPLSFDQNAMTATANGTQITVEQAIAEFNIVWGKWDAMGQPAAPSVKTAATVKPNIKVGIPTIPASSSSTTSSSTGKTSGQVSSTTSKTSSTSSSTASTSKVSTTTSKTSSTNTSKVSSTTSKSSSTSQSSTAVVSSNTSKVSSTTSKSASTSTTLTIATLNSSSITNSSTSTSLSSTTATANVLSSLPIVPLNSTSISNSTGVGSNFTMTNTSATTTSVGFNLVAPTNTGVCGLPPKPIPSPVSPYFKEIPCDNSFDKGVDDFLNYLSDVANLGQYLTSWAPNTGITAAEVQGGNLRRRTTIVRRYSFGDFLSDCVHVIEAVVDEVIKLAEEALNAIENLAESILPTWHPSISFDVPVDLGPPSFELDDSPWGDAFKIYEWHPGKEGEFNTGVNLGALAKMTGADQILTFEIDGVEQLPIPGVELWCVDCRVTGTMTVTGQATFTFPFGITDLLIKTEGDLLANFGIGLDGFAEYTATLFDLRVFEIGVPGFSIPGIIEVGPYLTFDINAQLKVEAVGQFLAGAELTWKKLSHTTDFLNPLKSGSHGFAPQVKPKFRASGNVTATASLGIPLALNIGVDILDGTFQEAIALVDRPAIEAVAAYSYTGNVVQVEGMDPCNGILYYSDLVNELTLEFFGQSKYDLGSWHGPKFIKGCVGDNGVTTVEEAMQAAPVGKTRSGCTLVDDALKNSGFEDGGINGETYPWKLDGGGASLQLYTDDSDTHGGSNSLQFTHEWVRDCGFLCGSSCGFLGFCDHCCAPPKQDWTATVSQKISMCTDSQYEFNLWARTVSSDGVCTITDVFVHNLDDTTDGLDISVDVNHNILPVTDKNKGMFPLVDGQGLSLTIPALHNIGSYNVEVGFHVTCKTALNFDVRFDDITLSPSDSAYANKAKRGPGEEQIKRQNNALPVVPVASANTIPTLPSGTVIPGLNPNQAASVIGSTTAVPGLDANNAAPTVAPANDAPAFDYVAQANAYTGTYTDGGAIPTATAVLLGPADYSFPAFSKVMASATLGVVGPAAPTGTAAAGLPFTGWSTLPELSGANRLAAADDGNLYLSANSKSPLPGTQFYSDKSIAYKDEQNRMFHYYPDTMNLYGVSRIRLSDVLDTPLTAQLITLVPVNTPSGVAYVAADTANHNFFLAQCSAPYWMGSKVFLVKDITAGLAELQKGEVQWIVTGNNVTECHPLVLTSSAGGLTPI